MNSTAALARTEVRRLGRNKQYSIFSIALPVVLYLVVSPQTRHASAYGVGCAAYYMIAMASVGAFSGALTGNAQRISSERKDGWIRQLRLTSLPPNAYVAAKVIASMVTTVPAVVIVLVLGRFYGGIHLALWKWLAIGGVIWLGALTFAALAVAIGYRFTPDRVQPVAMFVHLVMSLLGGLWFALAGWMQKIGQALPTYQITRVGTSVIGGGPVSRPAIGIILAWLAAFALLAVLAVGSTAETL
jgi:ABC-2 type transport system permease protein